MQPSENRHSGHDARVNTSAGMDATEGKPDASPRVVSIFAFPEVTAMREDEYRRFLAFVTDETRRRAERFLRFEDRCRCVAGEVLSRFSVFRFSGYRGNSWKTGKNEFGKPYLPEIPVYFNLSHSGTWVLCAVDGSEIGVDVELRRTIDPAIAERFFSAPERMVLAEANTPDEIRFLFHRLWVLKESYVKAIGRGLNCPLDSFACLPDRTGSAVRLLRFDDALPDADLRWFTLDEDHCGAVCALHAVDGIEIIPVTMGDLVVFITGSMLSG